MMLIEIRNVSKYDIEKLQSIARLTFEQTFSGQNSELSMTQYIEEKFSLEQQTTEFNNPNSFFYFVTLNDKILGYLKLNIGKAQTELKDEHCIEIERIYVLNEFHGKGVGQLLYNKAIEVAKQKKLAYVWLGVWEENLRAIQFYTKNGFVKFDKHVFKLGNEEQTDIMMKLLL